MWYPTVSTGAYLSRLILREVFHFCSLRAGPNAHFSIRRVALRIAAEIKQRHPALAGFIALPPGKTWQDIEQEYFSQYKGVLC